MNTLVCVLSPGEVCTIVCVVISLIGGTTCREVSGGATCRDVLVGVLTLGRVLSVFLLLAVLIDWKEILVDEVNIVSFMQREN